MTFLRRRAALVLVGLAPLLTACGAVVSATPPSAGHELTIFSSLPLQGPDAQASQALVNGEKLALAQAHGHVGRFGVSYYSLDDSDPSTDAWSQDQTASNAKVAAQNDSTIAYLGDYDAGATAISLPILNDAGILQITPATSYVGLTTSQYAGQDEPARFYPTNIRTFGRIVPNDLVQGAAVVALMRHLGVRSVYIVNDLDPFDASLAEIVTADAMQAGITVTASDTIDMTATDYSGEVKKVQTSGAGAVFYAGAASPGTAKLWQQLYAADGQLPLIGSSAFDTPTFTASLGDSAASTYYTTPYLAPRAYPIAAQRFFSAYRRAYGYPAPADALYGYEAMQAALQAIARAGADGDVRASVAAAFFRIHDRNSVLGPYSILPSGDTTISYYAADRVVDGVPTFLLRLDLPSVTATAAVQASAATSASSSTG